MRVVRLIEISDYRVADNRVGPVYAILFTISGETWMVLMSILKLQNENK